MNLYTTYFAVLMTICFVLYVASSPAPCERPSLILIVVNKTLAALVWVCMFLASFSSIWEML